MSVLILMQDLHSGKPLLKNLSLRQEQTRLVLQEQLARLVEQSGTTAILVTHSIEEAILLGDSIFVMSARPGRIVAEIDVHLPRPRSHATTHDPEYGKLFDRIYGLLRDEVMKAMASEAMG